MAGGSPKVMHTQRGQARRSRLVGRLVPLALLVACAARGAADDLFAPAPGSPLELPGSPTAVQPGDLDGDGCLDLVAAFGDPVSLRVLRGDGSGRFTPGPAQPLDLPAAAGELVLADLDGDGHLDLGAATHDSYDVQLLWGDGRGGFPDAERVRAKEGAHPHTHGLLAGDVDLDGKLDLLVVESNPDNVLCVLRNAGGRSFAPAPGSPFDLGRGPYPSALALLDGDQWPDLVSPDTQSDPPVLTLLRGDGRGGLDPMPIEVPVSLARPFFVAAGDLDGDRDLDLLVTHDDATRASLLLNTGGAFAESPASPFELGGPAWYAVIADLNGDHCPDFATAGGSEVRVFVSDAGGRFAPAPGSPYAVAKGSWRLALADLNRDGEADLVTCGVEEHWISILLHR